MSLCLPNHVNVLPSDVSPEYPGYACLLGNIVEAAGVTLLQPACPFEMVSILKRWVYVSISLWMSSRFHSLPRNLMFT